MLADLGEQLLVHVKGGLDNHRRAHLLPRTEQQLREASGHILRGQLAGVSVVHAEVGAALGGQLDAMAVFHRDSQALHAAHPSAVVRIACVRRMSSVHLRARRWCTVAVDRFGLDRVAQMIAHA